MRIGVFLLLILFSSRIYSQSSIEKYLDSTVTELKKETKIDKNDLKVFSLLENFYKEVLQSDKGELSTETAQKINIYGTDEKLKNKHLFILFLMYQQHISETAAQGKSPNAAYQVACINLLEKEFISVYQRVPTIIYIYKVEALQTAGRSDEANAVINEGLTKDPASIPLKVYKYLASRDQSVKSDLIKNHSEHWMVQQFGIK